MNLENWIPALISSGALLLVGRHLLKASIEKSVAHVFDRELEKVKADLRRKDAEISDLRTGALSGLSARQAELDRRKIQAASNLWAATIRQRRFYALAGMVSRLNLQEIRKATETNPQEKDKMMQLGEMLWKLSMAESVPPVELPPDNDQIFLPPQAWLCFNALRTIGSSAIAVIGTIKSGAPLSLLKESVELNEELKLALPDQADFINKYPDSGPYLLIKELEDRIFASLVRALNENDSALRAVEAASEIVAHSKLMVPDELPALVPDALKVDPPPLKELPR
ncbi:hypothetical protein ACCT08_15215 [Rhizobium johnstonii]|uniref:hypothetical protein n=1 Tax=Rhizobium johnstonii TaxID=3019933 RepID=UPI003F9E55A0